MGELVGAIASWPTFFLVLLVFGFAPGALLRLILLAYHREDPRRREMRAELRAVPRWERPIWVCEQLEEAIFDGLGGRIRWAATGRIIHRWSLGSGVRRREEHPASFWIPDEEEKAAVRPGVSVKLMFEMKDWGERMWVTVVETKRDHLVGVLNNDPWGIPRLSPGDRIKFKPEHIIDIDWYEDRALGVVTIEGTTPPKALEPASEEDAAPTKTHGDSDPGDAIPDGVNLYHPGCHGREGLERDHD
jgi:uncharacterized protein YegJ (DUF2314 family)